MSIASEITRLQGVKTNILQAISDKGIFTDYEITKGKMDDVFINVTGKKAEGGAEQ